MAQRVPRFVIFDVCRVCAGKKLKQRENHVQKRRDERAWRKDWREDSSRDADR